MYTSTDKLVHYDNHDLCYSGVHQTVQIVEVTHAECGSDTLSLY